MTKVLRPAAQQTHAIPYAPEHVVGDRIPGPAETIEVAPGVLWLRMPLPFALDHINLCDLMHAGSVERSRETDGVWRFAWA